MSKNKGIPAHYNCTMDKVVEKSIEIEAYLRRDIVDLASRGVTVVKLNAMKTEREAFMTIPSNKTEIEDSTKAVADRDKKAGEIVLEVRIVINCAKDAFGTKSATYKAFNIKYLSSLSAGKLYLKCGNIVVIANANLVAMVAKGLDVDTLTNITSLSAELYTLIAAAPVLKTDATIVTAARQTAANNVFDTTKAFCELGKSRYMDVNKEKYDNYITYDTPPKVKNRRGNLAIYGYKGPRTNDITLDTRFRLRTTKGESLVMYFSLLKRDAAPAGALEVLNNPNIFISKTAAQLGYNPATGVIQLNIYNPHEAIGAFWVKIG